MNITNLDEKELFILKWQYGILGDFKSALINAIKLADIHNLRLLARGFPIEVEAYELYTQKSGWWQEVQKKAELKP